MFFLKQIYTISIETGLQNVGIAFMIIMINFPSPESDYALLPLIAVSTITTLPLWVLFLVKKIFSKSKKYLIKENDKNSTAKKMLNTTKMTRNKILNKMKN